MLIMIVEPPSLSAQIEEWGHVQILATLSVNLARRRFLHPMRVDRNHE
jgi:hypothetical protein